jgi:hypothetical protein
MVIRNAAETRQRYQDHMGEELGAAFYAAVGHVHYLRAKWGDYTTLFEKQKRVELLNKVAPACLLVWFLAAHARCGRPHVARRDGW